MSVPVFQKTKFQMSNDIDLSKTALLVIDMIGGDNQLFEVVESAAKNVVELLNKARAIQMPVIFTCDAHILGVDQELELWGIHGIKGTKQAEPLAIFNVQESDFIVRKRRYDSFFQTDLDLLLRELGVDTLICTGADTNICVLQTLATAYNLNYKIILAKDACATFLISTQEAGVEYIERCYNARIKTTKEVLEIM